MTSRQPASSSSRKKVSFFIWLASLVLLMIISAVVGTAWTIRHIMLSNGKFSESQARAIMAVAEFPSMAKTATQELMALFGSTPSALIMDKAKVEKPYWVRKFPDSRDSGYLLLSGVDSSSKQSTVQLIRISDGSRLARWTPDWKFIFQRVTAKGFTNSANPASARAVHPLLLDNGDLVFNTWNSLVRLSPCSTQPRWIIDQVFHHSTDIDSQGAIWAPSVSGKGFTDNKWLNDRVIDDSLAQVSSNGHVLRNISFARALMDNGLTHLLFGFFGYRFNSDPMHINEIKVARTDSLFWKSGDLLISARHLSTLFLYRPSNGKIIWHQTGPWMNQHSADFVDDHKISVLSNNIVSSAPADHAFISKTDTNRVFVHDFKTGTDSEPYLDLLAKAKPKTITEGRARILPDGGLFVEETNYGRQLRFSSSGLMWSRINDYDEKHIGALAWSRYLTREEVEKPLHSLKTMQCSKYVLND